MGRDVVQGYLMTWVDIHQIEEITPYEILVEWDRLHENTEIPTTKQRCVKNILVNFNILCILCFAKKQQQSNKQKQSICKQGRLLFLAIQLFGCSDTALFLQTRTEEVQWKENKKTLQNILLGNIFYSEGKQSKNGKACNKETCSNLSTEFSFHSHT